MTSVTGELLIPRVITLRCTGCNLSLPSASPFSLSLPLVFPSFQGFPFPRERGNSRQVSSKQPSSWKSEAERRSRAQEGLKHDRSFNHGLARMRFNPSIELATSVSRSSPFSFLDSSLVFLRSLFFFLFSSSLLLTLRRLTRELVSFVALSFPTCFLLIVPWILSSPPIIPTSDALAFPYEPRHFRFQGPLSFLPCYQLHRTNSPALCSLSGIGGPFFGRSWCDNLLMRGFSFLPCFERRLQIGGTFF